MSSVQGSRKVSPVDLHVGMRLRLLRDLLDYSLEQVSELTDIDVVMLRRFESGALRIGATSLFQLASTMDMPVSWFFAGLRPEQVESDSNATFARRAAEALNYDEGLALITRCYELASAERREMLIAVAQSIVSQQARAVDGVAGRTKPEKRNGGKGC